MRTGVKISQNIVAGNYTADSTMHFHFDHSYWNRNSISNRQITHKVRGSNLPRSPHDSVHWLRAWLRSARGHRAAAPGLALQPATEAGFEHLQSLLHLREASRVLGTAVQAGRRDGRGHGLLHEVGHPLARVLAQAGLREQRGDALEAGFVAFSVAVCGLWRKNSCHE